MDINLKKKYRELVQAIESENAERIVDFVIISAMREGTSDIHIEPFEEFVRIRLRIDGCCQTIINYPGRLHNALVSRLKITSGLKIDEKRVPQDGRVAFNAMDDNRRQYEADLRVSTLPTVHGEKIVMRIAARAKDIPPYTSLGFQGNNLKYINELIDRPNGVIVVSGPTGSGKTVTLYSTLKLLNTEDVNIMTIEDPVELEMEGLSQCQTNNQVGLTFSVGLRAALRQDPDIIMIGEIRDEETAEVAMHAALTGHLVLSTIHTNSAAETINRFENMGVPKYIIASALRGVIAQRLVRRICKFCKAPTEMSDETFRDIENIIQGIHPSQHIPPEVLENITIYKGKGCDECNGTGYKGRLGVYEILIVNEAMVDRILDGSTIPELQRAAVANGMLTLKQDGVMKVLDGLTTIEEIYSVANET